MTPAGTIPEIDEAETGSRTVPRLAMAAVLILAFGLRAWGLGDQSLTMDEVAELGIATSGPGDILRVGDGFPPLFALLLHGWLRLFHTDAAARWLAVLLGCLSLLPVHALSRRAGGRRAGLWAALFIAVSPFHIWHSQEGRAYILSSFLRHCAWRLCTGRWPATGTAIGSATPPVGSEECSRTTISHSCC